MKVLVYPLDGNPYQRLLYAEMASRDDVTITYLRRYGVLNVILLPLAVLFRRVQGYELLHIHWPAFRVTAPLPRRDVLSYHFFRFCIKWIKALNYKLVWTVHNVIPHQPETSNDLSAAIALSLHADAKIVHSEATFRQMTSLGLSTANTQTIPHGSYLGVYPAADERDQARQRFGLERDDFVFLFFGLVRPYKGVADLILAFEEAQLEGSKLIIAGKNFDNEVLALVAESQKPNIILRNEYIPDSEVATYFAIADVACLPFRSVTTSGSALLALTFGVPVIAKRVGDLADLPAELGFFYEPDRPSGLVEAMSEAVRHKNELAEFRRAAAAYAAKRSWDKIAQQTYDLYAAVINA